VLSTPLAPYTISQSDDGYYKWDSSAVTYATINAIKEQQTQIESQQKQIRDFKAENDALKQENESIKKQNENIISRLEKLEQK